MKRMTQKERHTQLLEVARKMVRAEGSDALTLISLAERAGVTKPVTYQHFGTRSGLFIALAREIDDRQVQLLNEKLASAKPRLADVARVVGTAYMHCTAEVGPEWQSITAALKGDEQMEAVQRELLDRYARIYQNAFAPFTDLSKRELQVRCVAIVGAAEALAAAMLQGRINESTAAKTLTSLILDWLG